MEEKNIKIKLKLQKKIKKLELELNEIHYKFSCLLDHATGGMLSKTNYTKEIMYQGVNDYIEKLTETIWQEANKEFNIDIEALTERNKRLEEAVKLGAETFRGYAILHEAKPDMEKAKRNYVLAERLEAALEEEKE